MAAADTHPDLLASPEAGGRVVRGGLLRGIGYGAGTLIAAGTAVLLLRALGNDDFGRYGTVAALLGIVSGIIIVACVLTSSTPMPPSTVPQNICES